MLEPYLDIIMNININKLIGVNPRLKTYQSVPLGHRDESQTEDIPECTTGS